LRVFVINVPRVSGAITLNTSLAADIHIERGLMAADWPLVNGVAQIT
jgi:hypothetical protein